MSFPQEFCESRLIVGILYHEKEVLEKALQALEKKHGAPIKSPEINFNFTDFYKDEFGIMLKKIYIGFNEPFKPENLPTIKHECHEIEKMLSVGGKRALNVDPGYITKDSVVLASFKRRAHRICLENSVYADLQLVYENKKWKPFEWTFPDIMQPEILVFLDSLRKEAAKSP